MLKVFVQYPAYDNYRLLSLLQSTYQLSPSDYKGSDKDGDGIGDEIYLICSYSEFFLADSFPRININTGLEIDRSHYNQEKNEIIIFPNPAEDFIEISYPPSEKRGSGGVSIFDILGTEVLNNSQLSILNSQLRIDVSNLAPGLYFVRVGDEVRKFVKL